MIAAQDIKLNNTSLELVEEGNYVGQIHKDVSLLPEIIRRMKFACKPFGRPYSSLDCHYI